MLLLKQDLLIGSAYGSLLDSFVSAEDTFLDGAESRVQYKERPKGFLQIGSAEGIARQPQGHPHRQPLVQLRGRQNILPHPGYQGPSSQGPFSSFLLVIVPRSLVLLVARHILVVQAHVHANPFQMTIV